MHSGPHVFEEALTAALARWRIAIDLPQLTQLQAHYTAMIEANRVMNLTRITDPVEAAVKHYADSLALLAWVRDREIAVQSVLDLGTGAGFPAVPLAVMRPDWSVTAIDATRKKIDFVRRTTNAIGLKNLHCEHAHSEHWERAKRSGQPLAVGFQLVVFRALKALAGGIEAAAGYVAPGGWLIAYKTASMDPSEKDYADRAATKLGLSADESYPYSLHLGDETLQRVLHTYRKVV